MNSNDLISCCFMPSRMMHHAFNIKPDTWQTKLLDSLPQQALLLCSRQSGKSTVSSAMALHKAIYDPGSLVLIISRALRQSEELFRKVRAGLPNVISMDEVVRYNMTSLELQNGSRIIALPGKDETIRSFSSVGLLIIDEAAQVSDALYASVRPMLAISKGKLVALSTPFGKRGWFYNAWENGFDWTKVKITANDCPRITDDFIDNEIKEVGEWWVRQEYFCEFVDNEEQIFGYDMIMDSIREDVRAWAM